MSSADNEPTVTQWDLVERYSAQFRPPTPEDSIVLVPNGEDIQEGFARARELLAEGRRVRLIGLGVTVRAVWPEWVANEDNLSISELWAYRPRSTIRATRELRLAIIRWLDGVFEGAHEIPSPGEAFVSSACLRLFEAAFIAFPDVIGIANHHGGNDIHVIGSDWIGTPTLRDYALERGGSIHAPAGRSATTLAWRVRLYAVAPFAFAATVLEQIRTFARARRTRAFLTSLRKRTPRRSPETWVVVVGDWPRYSRTVIDSVAIPELVDRGSLGVLITGSLVPGARDETNMRRHVGDEVFAGLGTLRAELQNCTVDQVVDPERARDLCRLIFRGARASASAVARIAAAGPELKDGRVRIDLRSRTRELALLATLELARGMHAAHATRAAMKRTAFAGKRVVFASSSPVDMATADLLLQAAGAHTFELGHGSLGTGEPGARESLSQVLSVWSHADERVLQPLERKCIVAGLPRPKVPKADRKAGAPRVLFISNYLHVGYRIGGRFPLQPFQVEFLRAAAEAMKLLGPDAVRWRPHPVDDETVVEACLDHAPGLRRSQRGTDFGADLADADIVVSSPSSSVFQALLLDVPVFFHLTPEYADTPAADFIDSSRTFFRAEEFREKLVACIDSLATAGPDATLAPERAARIALFGPSAAPRAFWEVFGDVTQAKTASR